MYAVIRTGGKQYRVQPGDVLRIEKLDAEVGKNVTFDDVLLVGEGAEIKVGADAAKTSVTAVVTGEGRGKKVVVFKKRRRKNYRLTKGHRQDYIQVEITEVGGVSAAKKPAAKKAAPKAEEKAAPKKEAAAKKPAAKKEAAPKAEAAEKKAAPKKEAAAKKPAAKKEAAPKAEAAEKKAAPKKEAAAKKPAAKKEAAPKAEAEKKAAPKKAAAKTTKADKE